MKLSVKEEQREKYTEMAEGCECVPGQEEELKERKYSPRETGKGFGTWEEGEVCDRFIRVPRNTVQRVTHLSGGRAE